MNLFFELFSAGENAFGGLYMNIFRIITVILIIALTIAYKKRKNIPLLINKKTLWMKENAS